MAWVALACLWQPGLALAAGTDREAVDFSQSSLCKGAIAGAEAMRRVPDAFLQAIARVESGRADPLTGAVSPWPWTVNAEGAGSYYATKAEALTAVRALQARGVRSIDVGCMQVNLMHHPDAFASLEQAFDPAANAQYAAGFLVALFGQTGSWPRAAAAYHSQTPTLGEDYQRRVLAEWAVPDGLRGGGKPARAHGSSRTALAGKPASAPQSASASAIPIPAAPAEAAAPAPPGGVAPIGRMAAMVSSQPESMRPAGVVGRSLATYRLMPTRLAFRPPEHAAPAGQRLPRPPTT